MTAYDEEYRLGWSEAGREFCNTTSLHGWNHCWHKERPWRHTFGWLIVIMISTTLIFAIMIININEFANASVAFNVETTTYPLDDVFFPSFTICNMNALRKSFVHSLLKDPMLEGISFQELMSTVDNVFVKGQNEGLTEQQSSIVDKIIHSKTYDALYTEFLGQVHSNSTDFTVTDVYLQYYHHLTDSETLAEKEEFQLKRDVVTEIAAQFRPGEMLAQVNFKYYSVYLEYGFGTDISETCMWVTPIISEPPGEDKQDFSAFKPGSYNGVNNGLSLLLDAEAYDYASTIAGNEGFTLGVLHHLDIPILKHTGINIETGQSVRVAITPSLVRTTPACKRRFNPKKRQCYFDDEIKLQHFPVINGYRYNMATCLYESALQKIEKECNCTPVSFIEYSDGYSVCEGAKKKCMRNRIDDIGITRLIEDQGTTKECLTNCEDQKHSFLVSQAVFPNEYSFLKQPEFCVVLAKIQRSCAGDRRESLNNAQPALCSHIDQAIEIELSCEQMQTINSTNLDLLSALSSEVTNYARGNMVRLNLYVREPYVVKHITEEKITELSFVGNVGGLVGLFSGFSFISMLEIFYFLCCGRTVKTTMRPSARIVVGSSKIVPAKMIK